MRPEFEASRPRRGARSIPRSRAPLRRPAGDHPGGGGLRSPRCDARHGEGDLFACGRILARNPLHIPADRALMSSRDGSFRKMRAVLDYCTGGTQRQVTAGTLVVTEGGTHRPPLALMAASSRCSRARWWSRPSPSPARCSAKCRCCWDSRTRATVRACSDAGHLRIRGCSLVPQAGARGSRCAIAPHPGAAPQSSPTPISPISSANMPDTATISRWSAKCSRA